MNLYSKERLTRAVQVVEKKCASKLSRIEKDHTVAMETKNKEIKVEGNDCVFNTKSAIRILTNNVFFVSTSISDPYVQQMSMLPAISE